MEKEVEILARETFETGDTTFTEQLTRIKELNPHAVFVSALPTEKPAILIQAREVGFGTNIPFVVPELTTDDIKAAGDAANGAITVTGWIGAASTPGNQAFVENYAAKHGNEPDVWAAQSYATLYILVEAIANARSTDPAAIRDALAGTQDLDTILGSFSFDVNGDAVYESIVLIARDGKFEIFE